MAFKADYEASGKNLYAAHKRWREDNGEHPLPQRVAQISSAKTQNATIWSQPTICTLSVGSGAGDIWAFMFCGVVMKLKTFCSCVHASWLRAVCGTKERMNSKNQISFLYWSDQSSLKSELPNSEKCFKVSNVYPDRAETKKIVLMRFVRRGVRPVWKSMDPHGGLKTKILGTQFRVPRISTGTDVHNQPEIYIRNPAEGSHISPYICRFTSSLIWLYHNKIKEANFYGKV